MSEKTETKYAAKDFSSGIDVRWCPGCGDFSILAQVQRTFPQMINEEKEKDEWYNIESGRVLHPLHLLRMLKDPSTLIQLSLLPIDYSATSKKETVGKKN